MTLISTQGEVALRRLGALQGFYERTIRASVRRPLGRLTRRAAPDRGLRRVAAEVTLVRVVSIIEAYATDLGEDAVRARLGRALTTGDVSDRSRAMVEYLLREKLHALGTGSWDRLLGVWKDGLGIPVTAFDEYTELKLLRTTRHAIAHRVGEYTSGYRREAGTKLIALGIDPAHAAGLIPLSDADIGNAFVVARSFVIWLDSEILKP